MPPKKKEEPKGLTMFEQVCIFLLVLFFLGLIWYRLREFFVYYNNGETTEAWWARLYYYFIYVFVPRLRLVAALVCLFFLWAISYVYKRLLAMNLEEKKIYGGDAAVTTEAPQKNERWERVIAHANSANAADWRLAVIEADVMLDDLLKAQQYHGETLGERLKAVDPSDFRTLDNAWEAHRVRNQIAHQGGDFPLNEREARRAIALYESVFKEFQII